MYTKMENIRRVDFEKYVCNSDNEPIEVIGHVSVIYNTDVISDKEVEEIVKRGTYQWDNRVVVTSWEQADNMKGPTRPVINMYNYTGKNVSGTVFANSEDDAWKVLREQLSDDSYNGICKVNLVAENVKNGVIVN